MYSQVDALGLSICIRKMLNKVLKASEGWLMISEVEIWKIYANNLENISININ